jgi:hypothetical protein
MYRRKKNQLKMKSIFALVLAAICASTSLAFVSQKNGLGSQFGVARSSSSLMTMNAAERTYIMVRIFAFH